MIDIAIEGESDREAAKAVIKAAGHAVGRVLPARGTGRLDKKIGPLMSAARQQPWVVFRDSDGVCPVTLRHDLTSPYGEAAAGFQLRIAHTMTEAWLLADTDAFADYFEMSAGKIRRDPETLPHAKRALLALCARSRSRSIRDDMTAGNGEIGPLFVQRINEYAAQWWRPTVAAEASPSLARTIARISTMTE